MADNEIVKRVLQAPKLPATVKGDGRYLMTLLRSYLAGMAEQVNAANSFTADQVKEGKDGTVSPIRNFALTFDSLGGHLRWDSVKDLTDFKTYETRTNKSPGSDIGLLERTPKTESDRLPASYAATIYLYVIYKDGKASTPRELSYSKARPTRPTDIATTKSDEGTLITFTEVPPGCMGAYIYVDGIRYETPINMFLYTDDHVISKLEASYYDQFGEGERAVLYLRVPAVTGFIVERNASTLDYQWDPIDIHNVSYEIRVGTTERWETSLKLFTTKLNKHRYIYPNTGDCYMLIKAIDEHGNYSAESSFYFLTNKEDEHKNVVVRLEQRPTGYAGAKRNLYYDAQQEALLLESGRLEGAYLIDVALPQTFRARNWLDFHVTGAADDTRVFDDMDFLWDSQDAADTMWNGIAGDISGVEVKTEIAVKDAEDLQGYLGLLPFNGNLTATGMTATAKGRPTYTAGRWHTGYKLEASSAVTVDAAIPSTFSLAFWLKFAEGACETEFLRLEGDGGTLSFGYAMDYGKFCLTGGKVPLYSRGITYSAGDQISVGISQDDTTLSLYLCQLGTGRKERLSAESPPKGAFKQIVFDAEGGISL